MSYLQKISLIYLYVVPLAVATLGFGIGHVDVLFYSILWAVNVCLMLLAVWQLSKLRTNQEKSIYEGWTSAAFLLIVPWMLFSIFAGMGPPPVTLSGWLATATEQQVRYMILILGGIIALMGFALLKVKLERQGERLYSTLGLTVLSVAMPLFILNMIFWGFYLTDVFKYFVMLPHGKRPDWYPPVKVLFYVISVIEVALIYFATALFAIAFKKTNVLSTRASCWYIAIALIGIVLVILPPTLPEPLSSASYFAAIPAIPFIMPYLMGVRLLKR